MQDQENQGITRRRTYSTPHKESRRLTQRLRHRGPAQRAGSPSEARTKKAIYGWKLACDHTNCGARNSAVNLESLGDELCQSMNSIARIATEYSIFTPRQ